MNPLADFTYTLINYRPQVRYIPRVLAYYFKFSLFEPFRYLERAFLGKKIQNYKFGKDPIFILGYYRSGTTHLQEVLLQDKQFGYLNFYQTFFSTAFNFSEKFLKPICNVIIKSTGFRHPAHNIPFHFALPGEEDVAMVSSAFKLSSNWGQVYPKYFKQIFNQTVFFDDVSEENYKLFKKEFRDLVVRISMANKDKQLLLKSPPQTARIKMIKEVFPNAKFIYIRRNPYHVYKSNLKLWKSFYGQHLQEISQEEVKENIFWSYDKSLTYYEEMKKELKENELYEISYEDFLMAPLEKTREIYEKLELPGFQESQINFSTYISKKHGQNRASYQFPEEQLQEIETRLKKWIEQGNYSRP